MKSDGIAVSLIRESVKPKYIKQFISVGPPMYFGKRTISISALMAKRLGVGKLVVKQNATKRRKRPMNLPLMVGRRFILNYTQMIMSKRSSKKRSKQTLFMPTSMTRRMRPYKKRKLTTERTATSNNRPHASEVDIKLNDLVVSSNKSISSLEYVPSKEKRSSNINGLRRHKLISENKLSQNKLDSTTQTVVRANMPRFKPSLRVLIQRAVIVSILCPTLLAFATNVLYLPYWLSGFIVGNAFSIILMVSSIYVYYSYVYPHPPNFQFTHSTKLSDIIGNKKYNVWVMLSINESAFVKPIPAFMSMSNGYLSFYLPGKAADDGKYYNMVALKIIDLRGAQLDLPPKLKRWKYWMTNFPIEIKGHSFVRKEILTTRSTDSKGNSNFTRFYDSEWKAIYIFFETSPAKETWYFRFTDASKLEKEKSIQNTSNHLGLIPNKTNFNSQQKQHRLQNRNRFQRITQDGPLRNNQKLGSPMDLDFINAMLTQMTTDIAHSLFIKKFVAKFIERKMIGTNVPYFVDGLKIASVDFGQTIPVVQKVSRGEMETGTGLTMYVDLNFEGALKLMVSTKINIIKLLKYGEYFNKTEKKEDLPDEGGIEKEIEELIKDQSSSEMIQSQRSNRLYAQIGKFINIPVIQKLYGRSTLLSIMQRISYTPVGMQVIIERFAGTIAFRFPYPPSDRVWYGFTKVPEIGLSVNPHFGSTWLNIDFITDFLINALKDEALSQMLLPNMDNIYLPMMDDHVRMERTKRSGVQNEDDWFPWTEGLIEYDGQPVTDEDIQNMIDSYMP